MRAAAGSGRWQQGQTRPGRLVDREVEAGVTVTVHSISLRERQMESTATVITSTTYSVATSGILLYPHFEALMPLLIAPSEMAAASVAPLLLASGFCHSLGDYQKHDLNSFTGGDFEIWNIDRNRVAGTAVRRNGAIQAPARYPEDQRGAACGKNYARAAGASHQASQRGRGIPQCRATRQGGSRSGAGEGNPESSVDRGKLKAGCVARMSGATSGAFPHIAPLMRATAAR